ncbi:MAG TPA: T9SS type A sorting domain-containing protein, partial [Bacteroidia bacterium]|nr:T9SS type A sorting domain-containing protein [Bacteroidia bacterium]
DVLKNMLYAYNSDSMDEGQMGYGPNPPAMGLVFLNKSLNYTYGYRNDFSVFGNPTSSLNYYNYMRAIDKNGNHLQYDTSSLAANYIFPGSSDSAFAGLYWAQNASNGTDWRSLGTHGPFTFNAGAVIDLEVAYVFHQDNTNSIAGLKSTAFQVKSLYDLGLLGINSIAQSAPEKLHISPNPMKEQVRIAFSNTLNQVYTLKLIDAQGSVVFEQNNIRGNQVMLDKQNLASGLYFVMLQSADKMLQGKLTIE